MTKRAPISPADWIVAAFALEPNSAAGDEVRRMLQLESPAKLPTSRVGSVHKRTDTPLVPPKPRPSGPIRLDDIAPALPSALVDDARTMATARASTTPSPTPIVTAVESAATALDLSDDFSAAPLFDPLFEPNETRAIVAGAVSTRRYDGAVDVPKLVQQLARLRPLTTVPRQARASLQVGCQLLVDYSRAMEPFAADRDQLVHALRVTVGEPRVSVHVFRTSPLSAGGGAWRPRRATPIVVISDLGIGGPPLERLRANTYDWIELAARAKRARCPIVAFVPFGPKRWNPELTRLITHVQWDRTTSAGVVRRAIGRGHPAR